MKGLAVNKDFIQGAKDSLPIAAGYFSVSFTFGIMAASMGIPPITSGIISLTNVTSAGQFAGIELISAGAGYIELFLTQLIINLRYGLMSLTLSQNLSDSTRLWQRFLIAFGNTDEIFAVAVSRDRDVTPPYMAGLEIPPILSWTAGTLLGAYFMNLLPYYVQSALGIALYGMLIAIVLPPAREKREVLGVVFLACICGVAFKYLPLLKNISGGFSIIIITLLCAGLGALFFPVNENSSPAGDELPEREESV